MAHEALKKKFPEEGNLCKRLCGRCCTNSAPVEKEEAQEIFNWLIQNTSVEDLKAQFEHFDDQPDRCPFLKPDKGCFVYPVRPMVCRMFGHIPDVKGLPEKERKKISQQCPEGVAFTQIEMDDILSDVIVFSDKASKGSIRTMDFRLAEIAEEDGKTTIIPAKPGSAFERMRNATACFRCGTPFPKGGTAYLEGAELLCPTCEAASLT